MIEPLSLIKVYSDFIIHIYSFSVYTGKCFMKR